MGWGDFADKALGFAHEKAADIAVGGINLAKRISGKGNSLIDTSRNMSQVDRLYEAFQNAETGHLKGDDKFIRTEANLTEGGSSAYGPTQMTGTLVRDMLDRGVIPDHLKDYANKKFLIYSS